MPVNATLAAFSDYAYRSAVVIYLFAMLLHLGEFARVRTVEKSVECDPAKDVLAEVGARPPAGGIRPGDEILSESGGPGQVSRSWNDRLARMAVAQTTLGAAIHLVSVVLRGAATQRWPWGNMYEFISAICLAGVVAWLVVLRRSPMARSAGIFVLLPVEVLLFLAGTVLYVDASPVMPALKSYWLSIHVSAVSISAGLFMVSGVASMLYLVRHRRQPGRFTAILPDATTLDRIAYRMTTFAFVLYTFAIMTGAIWAEAAWGRFWGWDPKETVAFVVWVLYACYLHARSTAGWRNGGAAWINIAGFVAVLFNLFFVNLVTTGLHSYAGMN
ncbi:MAG: c-type cytochrome biogenesis protein CcsB [Actinomycetota bacterium]|nr:c-type cytochrome biogenesis protein CcsB [Actinomycetota bacterium]